MAYEATKKGYESFQKGDIPTLIRDLLDDGCTWISPGPPDKLPWAGTFKGKQEIATFFTRVSENLEFSEFAPREIIPRLMFSPCHEGRLGFAPLRWSRGGAGRAGVLRGVFRPAGPALTGGQSPGPSIRRPRLPMVQNESAVQ
jgi:hypothetical protein